MSRLGLSKGKTYQQPIILLISKAASAFIDKFHLIATSVIYKNLRGRCLLDVRC